MSGLAWVFIVPPPRGYDFGRVYIASLMRQLRQMRSITPSQTTLPEFFEQANKILNQHLTFGSPPK